MLRKVLPFVLVAGFVVILAGCAAVGALPIITQSQSSGPGASGKPVESYEPGAAANPGASVGSQAPAPASQPASASASDRQISVTGTGTASAAPDMAQIYLGVTTQNASVSAAVSDNQKAMTALLAVLKDQGIADADIRTSNYSLNTEKPTPAVPGKGSTDTGSELLFDVSNQVHVTVRNLASLPTVLDKVVAAGANTIFGVTFGIADPTSLQNTAREAAVKDALAKAQALAKLEGVTLGDVLSVSESYGGASPLPMAAYGLGGGGTPIQPGAQDISVTLQVTYAIK